MKYQVLPLSSDSAATRASSMSFGRQSKRPTTGAWPPNALPFGVFVVL